MNEYLAQLYDTNGAAEDIHMVKVAHLTVLNKLAQAEGVDLDEDDLEGLYDMDSEELEGLVTNQLEEAGYDPEAVYAQEFEDDYDVEDEYFEKESAAQLNEYDFAGRAMAHAFLDEKEKIAGYGSAFLNAAQGGKLRAGLKMMGTGGKVSKRPVSGKAGAKLRARAEAIRSAGKRKALRGAGESAALYGGASGLIGGGAYAASRKKHSSIDEIAESRALQIAEHYGLQKVASDEEIIDQYALEMLAEAGYDVDSLFED